MVPIGKLISLELHFTVAYTSYVLTLTTLSILQMFPSSPFRIVASTVLNSENKFFPEVVDCETIDGARVCTPSTVDTTLQVLDVPQESADSVFSNLMGKKCVLFFKYRVVHTC